MSNASSNDPLYWRNKYSETLRALETTSEESDRTGKMLSRAVIRLTLATGGLDARIDPYLTRIRDLLRKGIADKKLYTELDAISETLLRESKAPQGNPSGAAHLHLKQSTPLLFRFLKEIASEPSELGAITAVEAKVERGEIDEAGTLLNLLGDILHRHTPHETGEADSFKQRLLGRFLGRGKPQEPGQETDLIRARLQDMLDVIEIPFVYRDAGASIKSRLKQGMRSEELPALINEAIDFLGNVRGYIQREQREIESFLAMLNGRLSDLEHQAVGMDASAQNFMEARETEDASFSEQVEDLQTALTQTQDPTRLVALARERLAALDARYRANRAQELDRQRRTLEQIGKLTERLQDLELETTDLRTKLRLAHDMALRDPLTGLLNRKAYDERIAQEIARWRRFQHPFTLLVWDIDRFKEINDRYGHSAGDKVLIHVSQELDESIRETDMLARYGGEEFVMILCGANGADALRVAEQTREKIAHCGFNSQGRPVSVTLSAGLAEFHSSDDAQDIFERADQALYAAKQGGRNRCVLI